MGQTLKNTLKKIKEEFKRTLLFALLGLLSSVTLFAGVIGPTKHMHCDTDIAAEHTLKSIHFQLLQ